MEDYEQLQRRFKEKEQLSMELSHELLRLRIESKAAKSEMEDKLSSLNQQMTDLRNASQGKIQELTAEVEARGKKISALEEDLSIAQEQIKIFNEELTKTLHEEKKAKEVIAQLQSENKQVLTMAGKKSLDEMRISYEKMREDKKTVDEEIATCQQQARAYKRQVDDLNEKLRVAREKQTLQEKINETELESQLHFYKGEHTDGVQMKVADGSESTGDIKEMIMMFQQQLAIEKTNHQKTYIGMNQELEKMRNANMILQQKVRDAWVEKDALQDEIFALRTSCAPVMSLANQGRPYCHDPYVLKSPFEQTHGMRRIADHASQERHKLETKLTSPPATNPAAHYNQLMETARQQGNQPNILGRAEYAAGDIKENPVIQGIDRDIQQYADDVRRQTRPPPTQEFLQEEEEGDSRIPYDPNLTCPGCGKQYRFGEIQKLRHHVNKLCKSRRYTNQEHAMSMSDEETKQNYDVDSMKEIHRYANKIRRECRPPATEELFRDDPDSEIPYDSKLTCPGCGQRFREGEIQKLRRHVNEFCVSRKYTENLTKNIML